MYLKFNGDCNLIFGKPWQWFYIIVNYKYGYKMLKKKQIVTVKHN